MTTRQAKRPGPRRLKGRGDDEVDTLCADLMTEMADTFRHSTAERRRAIFNHLLQQLRLIKDLADDC